MIRVLFVEASSGGVVGGSLSGLYHLIRGMDRERFQSGMVLYEPKMIESDLADVGVQVHHVHRPRLRKDHGLLQYGAYHRAKSVGAVRGALRTGRQTARLVAEELPAALALARLIRQERYDVLHLGNGVRANFDGIIAGLMTRRPIIVHVKGFEKYSGRERWASRRIDMLICMTEAIRAYCRGHGLTPRGERVVYDAVDETWLRPRRDAASVRAELGISSAAPCIGILGNIQEWKGQRVLIEAMAQVVAAVPDAQCLVVGGTHRAGAEYDAQMRARCEALGLREQVHFIGFREDVPDVINALDIVVHASVRPEPFGRVILEGMLLSKPVVATNAGGVPELIENEKTGLLVPPGDAEALGEALQRLLRDPEGARAIGARAQSWARERFSLARQVAEMSEIYETAVRVQ